MPPTTNSAQDLASTSRSPEAASTAPFERIRPCLWFDGCAEEASNFYVSTFPRGRILATDRYTEAGPQPAGTVMMVAFEIDGQQFLALNGGPEYSLTPAVSFMVTCDTQAEIDALWQALSADGGEPLQCGWITDRFGVTWQIVPSVLPQLMRDADPQRARRVTEAMFSMQKLDIAALQKARG